MDSNNHLAILGVFFWYVTVRIAQHDDLHRICFCIFRGRGSEFSLRCNVCLAGIRFWQVLGRGSGVLSNRGGLRLAPRPHPPCCLSLSMWLPLPVSVYVSVSVSVYVSASLCLCLCLCFCLCRCLCLSVALSPCLLVSSLCRSPSLCFSAPPPPLPHFRVASLPPRPALLPGHRVSEFNRGEYLS